MERGKWRGCRSYSDTLGYTNLDRRKVEGVSVMKDKDLQLDEMESSHTLGGLVPLYLGIGNVKLIVLYY